MQDNRLCQIYIYWSSDNYMYCILPIKDAHPNTAPHTWGGGTKIIFIAWPNQVLQISQHISTPFNNLETCILLKKCLTLAMSPTCHNNNAGLPVGNSISGHIILGHFRPILCFWGMRLNFFYSVPIERTRQTTDNRQKVMHMSPSCKLHRWAQKSYAGLISLLYRCYWVHITLIPATAVLGSGQPRAANSCLMQPGPKPRDLFLKHPLNLLKFNLRTLRGIKSFYILHVVLL